MRGQKKRIGKITRINFYAELEKRRVGGKYHFASHFGPPEKTEGGHDTKILKNAAMAHLACVASYG